MSYQKNSLQAIIDRFFELQELKYREWEEDFVDEDTGDVVTLKRRELVTEEPSPEEEQLLEQINSHLSKIDTDTLFRLKDEIIWGSMNQYPIWEELNDRGVLGFPRKLIKNGVATLPEDMEEIPDAYFEGCDILKSVVFPKKLKRIGNRAFFFCDSLTDMHISDSVISIGDEAFSYCEKLTTITIPDSVISIGNEAFCGCEALKTIYIPDSVTEIGCRAFMDCSNLKSAYFGKGLKELKCQTFGRCYNLESVILSKGLEIISSWTFESCWQLRSLVIPSSVREIGEAAFEHCYFLTDQYQNKSSVKGNFGEVIADVIQEDGLMIKDNQVIFCWNTKSITIPRNITLIKDNAFYECHWLEEYYFEGTIEEWKQVVCEPDWMNVVHCLDGDYVIEY